VDAAQRDPYLQRDKAIMTSQFLIRPWCAANLSRTNSRFWREIVAGLLQLKSKLSVCGTVMKAESPF
jgi:hypothetical protein